MAIGFGDIVLKGDTIQGTNDGDLKTGDAVEQQTGAILRATFGNFRKYPTLGANLPLQLEGSAGSRAVAGQVVESLQLDGWRVDEMDISTESDTLSVTLKEVVKVSDETNNLV